MMAPFIRKEWSNFIRDEPPSLVEKDAKSEIPFRGDSSVHRIFPSGFSFRWLDKSMIYSSKNYAHGLVYGLHKYMACEFTTLHTRGIDDGHRMYTGVWRNAPEGGQAEKRKCHTQDQVILLSTCARRPCPGLLPTHPFLSIFNLSGSGRFCTRVTYSRPYSLS